MVGEEICLLTLFEIALQSVRVDAGSKSSLVFQWADCCFAVHHDGFQCSTYFLERYECLPVGSFLQ
jgi:hypothetical protein